jgi:hypothetical protein
LKIRIGKSKKDEAEGIYLLRASSAEQLKGFEPTIHLPEKNSCRQVASSVGHCGVPKAVALLILMTNRSFLHEEFSRTASFLLQRKLFDMLKMLGNMRSDAQDLVFP